MQCAVVSDFSYPQSSGHAQRSGLSDCSRWRVLKFSGAAQDWVRTVRLALSTVCGCRYPTLGAGRDERSRLTYCVEKLERRRLNLHD